MLSFRAAKKVVQHVQRKPSTQALLIRHLGGFGLFGLAILDGTPVPTFGSLDLLTAILAARHLHSWYYFAAISTVGSLIGAFISFRIGSRAGSAYITKRFGEERSKRFLSYFEDWGWIALAASTSIPIPFPTSFFFLAAGMMKYRVERFLAVVGLGRAVRYSIIAAVASAYGRQFIRVLRHPTRYSGWPEIVLTLALTVLLIMVSLAWRRRMLLKESGT